MLKAFALSILSLASAIGFAAAAPDPYPARPIKLIVSAGAGSVSDVRARWLAARLGPALGQPVVVENLVGGNQMIGTRHVARSAPDGYTLLLVHMGNVAINPHLYRDPGYDALDDFAPVARISSGYSLLTVNPAVPARTAAELIALAKEKPGKLNYGSTGIGNPPWMAAELFRRMANIDVTHIPYKGGGELLADLIGGRIDYWIEGATIQLQHVKAGRLRVLAVTSAHRLAILPDVPTVSESGLPGYEFGGWTGIAAPAATPRPVVEKLNAEIVKALNTPEAIEWLAEFANEPSQDTPEQFAAFVRAQHAKWGRVIREANIQPE
jgi:tripartite-type tricarboxylate transporter receptor subunit TctC